MKVLLTFMLLSIIGCSNKIIIKNEPIEIISREVSEFGILMSIDEATLTNAKYILVQKQDTSFVLIGIYDKNQNKVFPISNRVVK